MFFDRGRCGVACFQVRPEVVWSSSAWFWGRLGLVRHVFRNDWVGKGLFSGIDVAQSGMFPGAY